MGTRTEGIQKARLARTKQVKKKIETAVNILRMYGKEPTIRSIAEEAGVSKDSVLKYYSPIASNKNDT
jgi:DNA-directed RNA polymerase specialized sigma subunit